MTVPPTPGAVLCAYPTGAASPLLATGWELRALGPEAVWPDGAWVSSAGGEEEVVLASAGLFLVLDRGVGAGPASPLSVMAAGVSVMGGLELSGADGVPTGLVTGPRLRPADGLDLRLVGLLLDVGGQQLATACGASAAGHPAAAAAAALATAQRPNAGAGGLDAGAMIFSGRWTAPLRVPAGSHLTASFGHLGSVTLRVAG